MYILEDYIGPKIQHVLLCEYVRMYSSSVLAICVAGGYNYEQETTTINGSMV
jgi:hypothetical protein